MDERLELELWFRYSTVWRNVLTRVLEWPSERTDTFIEELRNQMEARINDPFDFGFFYDAPSHYLFRPILGNGLHARLMGSKCDKANPSAVWRLLTRAIAGGTERRMEQPDFDWDKARRRYQRYRCKVENRLVSRPNG